MSELPNTIGPGFQQDIKGRLDKLEELVLAMGEVMATRPLENRRTGDYAIRSNEDALLLLGIDGTRNLLTELKARRAARKETDNVVV